FITNGIRATVGSMIMWMVFLRLEAGKRRCVPTHEKVGIVTVVEGEAHGNLGLRGRLVLRWNPS
ncbi:hypothetical protein Tco_0498109, partial [Tanacetum coccineum]